MVLLSIMVHDYYYLDAAEPDAGEGLVGQSNKNRREDASSPGDEDDEHLLLL